VIWWESTINNQLFSFLDLVFQVASKRCNVVELTSGEWAIDEDNMRAEDGKGDQLLDSCVILLV
jgi:hypothetical protein